MTDVNKDSGVIHHIHHKADDYDEFRRELSLSGATNTVTLSSNNPKEDMNFLSSKALDLLRKVRECDQVDL